MREQLRERRPAEGTGADVLVPVPLRPAPVLRVVRVYQRQPPRPRDLHERVQRGSHPARDGEVVPGRPHVTGVEADAQPRMPVDGVEVRPEILQSGGQAPPATGAGKFAER